jgi:hypothetical protein
MYLELPNFLYHDLRWNLCISAVFSANAKQKYPKAPVENRRQALSCKGERNVMPLFATVSPAAGVRKILGNGPRSLFCVVLLAASPAYAATTTTTLTITSNGGAVTTVAPRTVVTLTAAVNTGAAELTTGQVNFCDASAT